MAKKRVGKFPKAFRQMAVERLKQCENIVEFAKELEIHRRLLYCIPTLQYVPKYDLAHGIGALAGIDDGN